MEELLLLVPPLLAALEASPHGGASMTRELFQTPAGEERLMVLLSCESAADCGGFSDRV